MIPLVAFVYQIKKNLMIRGLADVGQEKDKMVNEQLRYLIVNPNSLQPYNSLLRSLLYQGL